MEKRGSKYDWQRQFFVTDHVKHKNGFTLYKITSVVSRVERLFVHKQHTFEPSNPIQVYPKKNPEAGTKIVVWKRFNEFKVLYKELKRRHEELRIGVDFPKFAKSNFFNR